MAHSAAQASQPEAAPLPFIDLAAQTRRIGPRIQAAMARVVEHGGFIMGPEVAELETKLTQFSGARHVITCANGTDALQLLLMARQIGPGDAVFLPAFTFTATAEVVALLGATPVFVDVDPVSFNIDVESLKAAVEQAEGSSLTPKAVIAVDLFGQPADYPAINGLATEHDLFIIGDAAQSFGAYLGNQRSGTFAVATATSFFPAKPLGCFGDGGAVLTDDDDLAEICKSIRAHGKGGHKYSIVRVGLNSRLDTLQAAVLLEKLAIFDEEIDARQKVAARYSSALADLVEVPVVAARATSVWAQYTIKVDNRDEVATALRAEGIPTAVYYPNSLNRQEAYTEFPVSPGGVPVCEELSSRVLSLPMHPYLDQPSQDRVIDALGRALGA